MREIKFRARHAKIGEWYYGSDTVKNFDLTTYDDYLLPLSLFWLQVEKGVLDRETVGQYTGLKDKNGKEIYEGDILKTKSELMTNFGETPTGKYREDYYSIEYDETRGQFKERDLKTNYLLPLGLTQSIIDKYSEVIGNIWESRELLNERESR